MKIGRFVMRKSMFIVGLIAVFTLIVALIIQVFTSYYIYNYQGNIPSDYRVAVVFGAKVQANGQPTRFLKDRLDAAIRLYKEDQVDVIYHLKRALFLGKVFGLDCIGYNADSGPYKTEGKQIFREILANIKALLDIGNERAPEVIIAPKK
ncbi:hypothetical protein [Empedobacter sp.]|uniref:hypothetical protein n=1 Tax=Empedobacter sp. TaxID=1927715 RepID=UPI00289C143A|nr:hypothetical protein [Empedobacter sp.]